MNKFSSTLCAALAATFAAGSALPVAAAPVFMPKADTAQAIDVQFRWNNSREERMQRRENRRERRFDARQDRREDRFERRQDRREARFERRNGNPYYNGRRGYRERRDGYRYYNGFWFPASAFIAGAIISGAIANQSSSGNWSAHVRWCDDRYRTYRSSDNTYMSSSGYRRECNSPYG